MRKNKKVRYEMRYRRASNFYRLRYEDDVYVCAHALWELFDLGRHKRCDIVVETKRPRGSNYQVLRRLDCTWEYIGHKAWGATDRDGVIWSPMAEAQLRLNTDFPDTKILYVSVYS